MAIPFIPIIPGGKIRRWPGNSAARKLGRPGNGRPYEVIS
jgi:hypothetical protein